MTNNCAPGPIDQEPGRAARRQASNHVLTVLINVGLTYQKTHGDTVARQSYARRGISEAPAARVLSRPSGHRRPASEPLAPARRCAGTPCRTIFG